MFVLMTSHLILMNVLWLSVNPKNLENNLKYAVKLMYLFIIEVYIFRFKSTSSIEHCTHLM